MVRAQKEQLRTQLEFKVQEKGPQVQVRIRIQSQTAGQLKKKIAARKKFKQIERKKMPVGQH